MAQNIVRKGRVKRLVVERKIFGNVALFETCSRTKGSRLCEFFRATDPRFINIHSHDLATDFSARCKAYPPEPQPISKREESEPKSSSCGISCDSSVVTQLVWPKSWP